MSNHPFPPPEKVREAYFEVVSRNQSLDAQASAAKAQAAALPGLEAAFGKPSPEAEISLHELAIAADKLDPDEDKNLVELDDRYGELFGTIGVELVVRDVNALARDPSFKHNQIAPDVHYPHTFVEYLGDLGCRSVYADAAHKQLALDAVTHIYETVRMLEAELTLIPSPDNEGDQAMVDAIEDYRDTVLGRFQTILSFNSNAGYHIRTPAYVNLKRRVQKYPPSSL